MARRQTIPLADVRAPTFVDDQMGQAEVQANVGGIQTAQDLISIIASQLRLAQGSRGWLEPPAPGVSTGTIDLRDTLVVGELLAGDRDGSNVVFRTNRFFLNTTCCVAMNGLQLTYSADYVTVESGGTGTGFDAIRLTGALPPVATDRLTASYVRAA